MCGMHSDPKPTVNSLGLLFSRWVVWMPFSGLRRTKRLGMQQLQQLQQPLIAILTPLRPMYDYVSSCEFVQNTESHSSTVEICLVTIDLHRARNVVQMSYNKPKKARYVVHVACRISLPRSPTMKPPASSNSEVGTMATCGRDHHSKNVMVMATKDIDLWPISSYFKMVP